MDERRTTEEARRSTLPEDLSRRMSETERFLDAHPAAGSGRLPVWVAAACLGAGVLLAPGCGGKQKEGDIPKAPAGLETALMNPDTDVMDPAVMEPELESQDSMDPLPGQQDPPPVSMEPIPPPPRGADDSGRQKPFTLTGSTDGRPMDWKMPSGPVGTYGAPPMSPMTVHRPPVVRENFVTSTGGKLDPVVIRSVVRRCVPELRHCYQSALQRKPTLAGKITAQFVIGVSGLVEACNVQQHLDDHQVGDCLRSRALRWRFPEPEGGRVIVTYDWTFSPPQD